MYIQRRYDIVDYVDPLKFEYQSNKKTKIKPRNFELIHYFLTGTIYYVI